MRLAIHSLILFLTLATAADASEVARTRDGDRWLVSKAQGGQDWLVTYDASRGTVSGSVKANDGAPTLLDCDITSFSAQAFYVSCFAAVPGGWEYAATTSVTREFLGYPADPYGASPTPRPSSQPTPRPTPRQTPRPTAAACPNVAGAYATIADYSCGEGSGTVSLQQIGCDVSGTITSLNSVVPVTGYLSGHVGFQGEITGSVAISGTCFGTLEISSPPDALGRYFFRFESAVTCTGAASSCNIVAGTLILY